MLFNFGLHVLKFKPFYLMLTLCMNLRHLKGKTMAMAMACKTMALLGV